MLAAVAARLPKAKDNVWVDLGGGTGVRLYRTAVLLMALFCARCGVNDASLRVAQENVLMMAEYTDLSRFKAIYVVDLCNSLCNVARKKFEGPEFRNVHVIEADACTFTPEKLHIPADLITYSYSLSSAQQLQSLSPHRADVCAGSLAPHPLLLSAPFCGVTCPRAAPPSHRLRRTANTALSPPTRTRSTKRARQRVDFVI
jgi:hypothetical protein